MLVSEEAVGTDQEYVSTASIDNPPKEPKEGKKQEELFDTKKHNAEVIEFFQHHGPKEIDYSLTLSLKSSSGAATIKLDGSDIPANQFEEILDKRIHSDYFRQLVRGVVGMPLEPKEQMTLVNPYVEEAKEAMGEPEYQAAVQTDPTAETVEPITAEQEEAEREAELETIRNPEGIDSFDALDAANEERF